MHGVGAQDFPVGGVDAVALQHGAEPLGQGLEFLAGVLGEGGQKLVAQGDAPGVAVMLQAGGPHDELGRLAADARHSRRRRLHALAAEQAAGLADVGVERLVEGIAQAAQAGLDHQALARRCPPPFRPGERSDGLEVAAHHPG